MAIEGKVKRSFYNTFDHPFRLEKVEAVACDLCGSEAHRRLTTELGFEVRRCRDCAMVYVSPQPVYAELDTFYEAMCPEATPEQMRARSLGMHERHLRRLIEQRKPEGGRLLDAGCGLGMFLKHMEDSSWELSGIELSETAAAHAQSLTPRARIHRGLIEDAPIEPGSQDCITVVAVLEHMKSPRRIIELLRSWLAPGGLLALQVPHVTPFVRLRRWFPIIPLYYEAPHHLFDFPPQCVRRYLVDAGFEDVRFSITPPYASLSPLGTAAIWTVKSFGRLLQAASGGDHIYPFVGSYVAHAVKPADAEQGFEA